MVKRRPSRSEQDEVNEARRKRGRYLLDRLSSLSDELVLRTLSFLPVSSLVVCQRYATTACTTHVSAYSNFIDYHTVSILSLETLSSGSLPTTTASCAPERYASRVFGITAAQRRHSFTPHASRDGSRTSTWFEEASRRIGRSNTSSATIGQGAVAISRKSKWQSVLLCHRCWYDCTRIPSLQLTRRMG